jgi:hypothetical protein
MALIINPIDITTQASLVPDVSKLTTKSIDGTGVFDVLMKVTKLHLEEEYSSRRITGKEYATVYLGALAAVLQQAVVYLINNSQVEKLNAEIGLIRQQTVTELTQTDNDIPLGLGFNGDGLVEGLVANQKALSISQIAKVDRDMELVSQQIVTELSQTDNEIPAGIGFNNSTFVEGLVKSQIDKVAAEVKLTNQKTATEIAQITDVLPAGISNSLATTITGLVKAQKDLSISQIKKTDGEVLLLGQKTITELAQTADIVPTKSIAPGNTNPWLNDSGSVTGVLNKQKGLYAQQTEGFKRDAEQKLAKLMVDSWTVRRTTDEGVTVDANGLADIEIQKVLTKAKTGIGVV